MVRSTLLQVTRGRQIGLRGGPPVDGPRTPLTSDISGSCKVNGENSTSVIIIFNKECFDMLNVSVRQARHQKHGPTFVEIVKMVKIDVRKINREVFR